MNMFDVSSTNTKIHDFFNFGTDIHKMVGCTRQSCDILNFLKELEEVIFDREKNYEDQRNFFMIHCSNHPNVFNCLFKFKSKKENAKTLVQNLKIIRESQKEESEQAQSSQLQEEKTNNRNKVEKNLNKIVDSSDSNSD